MLVRLMSHDVYVCYDDKDQEIANKICNHLEKKSYRCWLKSRDVGVGNVIDEMMEAINNSILMVLVYSEDSKRSNFVNTEVDFAFGENKQIIVYNIDGSNLDGGLEFLLKNKPMIEAHPNPEGKFGELVSAVNEITKPYVPPFWKRYKIPIIAVVAIVLIAMVGVFVFTSSDGGGDSSGMQINAGDIAINVTDFHVDDVTNESSSWNYSYFVGGTVSPNPSNPDDCRIIVDFYDQSGKLVDTSETVFSEAQKFSSGFIFGSAVSDTNNIKRIDVQLVNSDNVILAQCESQL